MAAFCASGARVHKYAPLRFSNATIFSPRQPDAHRSSANTYNFVSGFAEQAGGILRDAVERFPLRV